MSSRKRHRKASITKHISFSPSKISVSTRKKWIMASILICLGIGIGAAIWWLYPLRASDYTASDMPPSFTAAYVDNKLCLGCHQAQANAWRDSHHALAMTEPTSLTVYGDFNNKTFTHEGVTSRFFQREGKYFINTEGPDGKMADFAVSYTFGVAPLQQYLISLPGGRLQAFQIAWDTERKRWFHLLPREQTPPGDVLHWTGRYQNANTMCLTCHTTGFKKGYDAATDSFSSTWHEPNVSCQACHGPGEKHLQWATEQAKGIRNSINATKHLGLTVTAQMLSGKQQADVCSACHSRRSELSVMHQPSEHYLDNHRPSLLTEGLYHADGQQLDEVFVDSSFRQSKMFAMGVSCTNCHNAHSGKLKLPGNAVCTQCHGVESNPAFPSAKGNYDSPAHHFHQAASAGAQCVSCHMPTKVYMQIQARPDHAIRIPRPDLSMRIGTPNACNQCHSDKSAQWASKKIVSWYGPGRRKESHYGETFFAARLNLPGSLDALTTLASNSVQPSIVRATALDALRHDGSFRIEARIAATNDPDPLVRASAADSLENATPERRVGALFPLLSDPIRAVRIAAARAMSTVPYSQLDPAQYQTLEAALSEYIATQQIALDMPGARLNLGALYASRGQYDLAESHYLAALKIDPDFTPARANLAILYNTIKRNSDAERVLREGLKRRPDIGVLHYSLGLLLAEEQQMRESVDALANAARLLPGRSRIHYNLGLGLMQLRKNKQAEMALQKAHNLDPADAAIPYALAILHAQSGQRKKALEWAMKALSISPNDRQALQLVDQLQTAH